MVYHRKSRGPSPNGEGKLIRTIIMKKIRDAREVSASLVLKLIYLELIEVLINLFLKG